MKGDMEIGEKEEEVPYSRCPLITSICGLLCCAMPFGLLSVIFAVFGHVEHRSRQFRRYLSFKKPAYAFGITAIVLGSLLTLILFVGLILGVTKLWPEIEKMIRKN